MYVGCSLKIIDSLYLKGNIEDAFNLETEEYLSLQLYKIDSIYNDSRVGPVENV
jgi:hypothetical protein